jgi:hypothetical protein
MVFGVFQATGVEYRRPIGVGQPPTYTLPDGTHGPFMQMQDSMLARGWEPVQIGDILYFRRHRLHLP